VSHAADWGLRTTIIQQQQLLMLLLLLLSVMTKELLLLFIISPQIAERLKYKRQFLLRRGL
jgi:uncharacterized membrane protein